MTNNLDQVQASSDSGNLTPAAAPARSSQQAPREPSPKNPQQRPSRRELTNEQRKRLDQLFAEKMKNPFAALELLYALEAPGARFVGFGNNVTTQFVKVLQDADRGLSALDRVSAMDMDVMAKRHAIERDIASCMEKLVDVTSDIAILANRKQPGKAGKRQRPVLMLDPNVKKKMKEKGAAQGDDAEDQVAAGAAQGSQKAA